MHMCAYVGTRLSTSQCENCIENAPMVPPVLLGQGGGGGVGSKFHMCTFVWAPDQPSNVPNGNLFHVHMCAYVGTRLPNSQCENWTENQPLLLVWMFALERYCDASWRMAYMSATASQPTFFVSFDPCDHVYYMATTPNLLTLYPRSTRKGTRSACCLARPRDSFS